jgi:Mg/Co/Ni transporter MgtE
MGLALMVAAGFGFLMPLVLARLGVDPALSPGGVTAATDIVAYACVLAITACVLA